METRQRTLVKAVIWNLMGLAMMAMVGFLMTGSVRVGGTMALVNTVIGFATYILYERFWSKLRWGRHV